MRIFGAQYLREVVSDIAVVIYLCGENVCTCGLVFMSTIFNPYTVHLIHSDCSYDNGDGAEESGHKYSCEG